MAIRHTTKYRVLDGEPQLGYTEETDIYTTLDEIYTEITNRCISNGIMPIDIILFDQNEDEINIEVYKYINPTKNNKIFVSNFMTEEMFMIIDHMLIIVDTQDTEAIYNQLTNGFTQQELFNSINI